MIQLEVMLSVRYPHLLRNVGDLAFERGIDICHEAVRKRVNRFGPMFAAQVRSKHVQAMRQHTHWRWHLDEDCHPITAADATVAYEPTLPGRRDLDITRRLCAPRSRTQAPSPKK